jgi:hypothetical protein
MLLSRALPAAHDTAVEVPAANGPRVDVAPMATPIPKNKMAVAAKTAMAVVSCFFMIRPGQKFAQMN